MGDYHDGHRQRVRDKYAENPDNFKYDYEYLELLLMYSIPRRDVKDTAKELLKTFGSIDNVFNADYSQLCAVKGVGENTAILISLVKDIEKQCKKSRNSNIKYVGDSESAVKYFKNLLDSENNEKMLLASVDNSNRIICCRTVGNGDVNHVDVSPRKIIETVMLDNPTKVIIAHNHPSGSAEPSINDIDFTLNVRNILASVNVELADHIIIGENDAFSMRNSYRYSKFFRKVR